MPFADIKCIREVSSEDNNYAAENLIKHTAKKWKTRTCGEKVAFIVLELSEPRIITGIDIGNEHSAFIEVLVSKTCCNTNDFTEILVTCSFMTLIESKNSIKVNRVRCFNKDALVPSATSEKWQFIKVICSQPFNKHVQYGISFIKLHVDSNPNKKLLSCEPKKQIITTVTNSSESVNNSHLGKFRLRAESPESDSENSTSLFKRWKASEMNTDSRSSPIERKNVKMKYPVNDEKLGICLDRNRKELGFGSKEANGDEILSIRRQGLLEAIEIERQQLQNKTGKSKVHSDSRRTIIKSSKTKKNPEYSGDKTIEKVENKCEIVKKQNEKTIIFRPFNEILKGNVLVISGIQNPDRTDIRDKALSMGGRYKSEWGTGCTHLICAFKNTPKYNHVRGKGKIVTRAWIEDCYKQKKRLPWRRYALDSSDLNQPHSEEEELNELLSPIESTVTNTRSKDLDLKVPIYNPSNSSINDAVSSDNNANKMKISGEKGDFDVSTEEEDFLEVKTKSARKAKLK